VTAIEVCESPIFVVGAPRSGTSMMQWALRQHPKLWGGQESDYLIPLAAHLREVHDFGSQRGKLHWLSGQKVSLDEFVRFVGLGVNALYTKRAGGRRWVEQTPQYTLHMQQIVKFFPAVAFLFMLRDGRQVVSSLRNFVNPMDHEQACHTWVKFVNEGLSFKRGEHGDSLSIVRYEDVVSRAEETLRAVYDFLGEPFEKKSVEFIETKRINSSFGGSTKDALVPRWLTWTREERRTFDAIAGRLLIELGYASDPSWVEAAPDLPATDDGERAASAS
jgi:hypothetical protein